MEHHFDLDHAVLIIPMHVSSSNSIAHIRTASDGGCSRGEHLLEDVEQVVHGRGRKPPEVTTQSLSIHSSKLIGDNLTVLARETA
jgi:hypothetical protein